MCKLASLAHRTFALRSYLPAGHPDKAKEIGSEPTPEAFVATMVAVFGEVRRVLRDDGTLWVNLGDSYSSTPPGNKTKGVSGSSTLNGIGSDAYRETLAAGHATKRDTSKFAPDGNQLLIPHRVAMALQADGWFLRSTIIWNKPAPMPESVSGWRWRRCRIKTKSGGTMLSGNAGAIEYGRSGGIRTENRHGDTTPEFVDCPGCAKCTPHGGYVLRRGKWRPTTGHEYIFMFSKSASYFCDGDACQEKSSPNTKTQNRSANTKAALGVVGREKQNGDFMPTVRVETRNPRSVWTISSEPYKEAHFATFPGELARRCIVAGTSAKGCCPACGSPWAPVVESERVATRPGLDNVNDESGMANRDPQRHVAVTAVKGYRPTCECPPAEPVPSVVLDPFAGSGTVLQICNYLGRQGIGIELNPEYARLAEIRANTPWHPPKSKRAGAKKKKPSPHQTMLFR